jgi:hypothetical protein
VLNRNEVDMGGVTEATRKAKAAFDQLAQASPAGAKTLLDQLSKYTDTLDHNSHQYEVNRKFIDDERTSLGLQTGAAKAAAKAQGDLGGQVDSTTGSITTQVDAMNALNDAVEAQTDPFFAVIDAERSLTQAQQEDASTKDEQARKAEDVAQAALALQAAQRSLVAAVQDGTTSSRDAITQLQGMRNAGQITQAQFQTLAEQVLIAAASVKGYNNTPIDPKTAVVNVDQAIKNIGALVTSAKLLNSLPKIWGGGGIPTASPNHGGGVDGDPNTPEAWGGVVQVFADGGFPTDPVIQPTKPGGYIKAFESEAGPWEAFIPGAPSKRDRAKAVWLEAGRKLGAISFADGGLVAGHTMTEWQNLDDALKAQAAAQAEQVKNMTDWSVQMAEQNKNFGQAIAILQGEQKAFVPWSNDWTSLQRQIVQDQQAAAQALADAAAAQRQAVQDQVDKINAGRLPASQPGSQVIEQMVINVNGTDPRAFFDEAVWRLPLGSSPSSRA